MADFSPEAIAKSVHATLDEAFAAIPEGRSHALIVDGEYYGGRGVRARALYVQRVGKGWNIALEGDWNGNNLPDGKVSLLKSW